MKASPGIPLFGRISAGQPNESSSEVEQRLPIDPATFDPAALGFKGIKGARDANLINRLRVAMLANGVDIMGGPGGIVSASHGPGEVAQTLDAFRTAVRRLKLEGDIGNA